MRRAVLTVVVLTLLAGCGQRPADPVPWQDGRLTIGTGSPTGVFYQVGGGYADVITKHLPGYEANTAATAGSADNLLRLTRGDIDIALTFADVAGDAMRGVGDFAEGPPPIRALARLYGNYTHLVVRADARIDTVADLKGRRVATSGADSIATRLLVAAGIDPERDIVRYTLPLAPAADALQEGTVDALFWTAGLPTDGIAELIRQGRSAVRFLPLDGLLPALDQRYPATYVAAAIPKSVYGTASDIRTVAVVSLVVVPESLPEDLAYHLTRLIFEYRDELLAVHPEWRNVDRANAAKTDPVALHPGAVRFYGLTQ